MHFQILSTLAILNAAITFALPTELKDFLLVTTSQAEPTIDSKDLKAVSASSLFDPYYQPAVYLRTIGPGYGSLPTFTLSSGTLHTISSGPHGIGTFEYNSTTVEVGKELAFLAEEQTNPGNLALSDGYLLTVNGEKEGWTICDGELGQEVLSWKGRESGKQNCVDTFVHAVTKAPY